MEHRVYPAIFDPSGGGGYTVTFPDLPGCITEGDDLDEALYNAREALELHLYGMEEDGDAIPSPTLPEKIAVPKGAFITIIEAWMDKIRDEMENRSVKKTLTLPKWLNDVAEARGINFSSTLQYSLKNELGIREKHPR